jgi:hypothetical protein
MDCKTRYCVDCKAEWHENTTCEKYQEWAVENKNADALSMNAILKTGAKPCPFCKVWIVRIDGCSHMVCRNCKNQFQWDSLTDNTRRHAFQTAGERAAAEEEVKQVGALADQFPKATALYAEFCNLTPDEQDAFKNLIGVFVPRPEIETRVIHPTTRPIRHEDYVRAQYDIPPERRIPIIELKDDEVRAEIERAVNEGGVRNHQHLQIIQRLVWRLGTVTVNKINRMYFNIPAIWTKPQLQTFTVFELKTLARIRGVQLRSTDRKEHICDRILDQQTH